MKQPFEMSQDEPFEMPQDEMRRRLDFSAPPIWAKFDNRGPNLAVAP
jgi:hypothetical protein